MLINVFNVNMDIIMIWFIKVVKFVPKKIFNILNLVVYNVDNVKKDVKNVVLLIV